MPHKHSREKQLLRAARNRLSRRGLRKESEDDSTTVSQGDSCEDIASSLDSSLEAPNSPTMTFSEIAARDGAVLTPHAKGHAFSSLSFLQSMPTPARGHVSQQSIQQDSLTPCSSAADGDTPSVRSVSYRDQLRAQGKHVMRHTTGARKTAGSKASELSLPTPLGCQMRSSNVGAVPGFQMPPVFTASTPLGHTQMQIPMSMGVGFAGMSGNAAHGFTQIPSYGVAVPPQPSRDRLPSDSSSCCSSGDHVPLTLLLAMLPSLNISPPSPQVDGVPRLQLTEFDRLVAPLLPCGYTMDKEGLALQLKASAPSCYHD